MRIGVPRETAAGERRVALVPELVAKLTGGGFEVLLERGAGEAASFPDAAYEEAGAQLVAEWAESDAVVKVQKPSEQEASRLRDGQVLVLGAGVAGLQAVATARRLGSVVTGFDVRPVVREQIERLGASWLDLGVV